jgi:pyruvate dehydrogenase E1 component
LPGRPQADTFRRDAASLTAKWEFTPDGQHIELGIAEMNLFLLLGAAGLSHSLFGKRLIPIGTVYDPFVARGLDALNYACYQDARFMIVGTPSGVTLAPEGGAHQSIGSPLIGMSQDGLAAFEPAFADELAVIMEWAFDYMQRDGEGDPDERTWLRDETGGSVYLRLTTNPIEQPGKRHDEDFRQGRDRRRLLAAQARAELRGGHRLPGRRGARGHRAAGASGRPARCRRAGRHLGRPAQRRLDRGTARPARGNPAAKSHIETLTGRPAPRTARIVTVIDGHPATLAWLGSVHGHQTIPLGVEHFGQTGTIGDLYRHFGIET